MFPWEKPISFDLRRGSDMGKIYKLLMTFFNEDDEKVNKWLHTRNPILGNQVPLQMINERNQKKILTIIENALEGNSP